MDHHFLAVSANGWTKGDILENVKADQRDNDTGQGARASWAYLWKMPGHMDNDYKVNSVGPIIEMNEAVLGFPGAECLGIQYYFLDGEQCRMPARRRLIRRQQSRQQPDQPGQPPQPK